MSSRMYIAQHELESMIICYLLVLLLLLLLLLLLSLLSLASSPSFVFVIALETESHLQKHSVHATFVLF